MRIAAFLTVLLVALAGCSGNDEPQTQTPPTNTQTSTSSPGIPDQPDPTTPPREPITQFALLSNFTFSGCNGVAHHYEAPAADVQALLPAAYVPVESALGTSTIHTQIEQCTSFDAAGSNFPDTWLGRVYVEVEPQNGTEDRVNHYVLQMIAGEDIVSLLWKAAGYDTYNGSANITDITGIGTFDASVGDYQLQASTQIPGSVEPAAFAWYHEQMNGDTIRWVGNMSVGAQTSGVGNLMVPDDSPLDDMTGSSGLTGSATANQDAAYEDGMMVKILATPI